jgi:hypothetical protein
VTKTLLRNTAPSGDGGDGGDGDVIYPFLASELRVTYYIHKVCDMNFDI